MTNDKTGWKVIKEQLPDDVLIDWTMSKKNCARCGAKLGTTEDCVICKLDRESEFIEVEDK